MKYLFNFLGKHLICVKIDFKWHTFRSANVWNVIKNFTLPYFYCMLLLNLCFVCTNTYIRILFIRVLGKRVCFLAVRIFCVCVRVCACVYNRFLALFFFAQTNSVWLVFPYFFVCLCDFFVNCFQDSKKSACMIEICNHKTKLLFYYTLTNFNSSKHGTIQRQTTKKTTFFFVDIPCLYMILKKSQKRKKNTHTYKKKKLNFKNICKVYL